MRRIRQGVVCVVLVVCAGAVHARAQPRQQVYDFADTAIEGELVRPDASLVTARPTVEGDEGEVESLTERVGRGAATDADRLRLAELLAARMNRHRVEAFRAMDDAFRARTGGDIDGRARAARVEMQATRSAREAANAALDALHGIARTASRSLRAKALSLEIYLLGVLERPDAALEAASRLVRTCPSCPEAAEAQLHLAEHAFAEGDVVVAEQRYDRVLTVPGADPQLVAYAHYKRGWVHINLGRLAEAWTDLEAARTQAVALGTRGHTLAREAGRDLVRVLSMQRVAPEAALSRLDAIAVDARERRDLADRYERMLRDTGRLTDADDFARAR